MPESHSKYMEDSGLKPRHSSSKLCIIRERLTHKGLNPSGKATRWGGMGLAGHSSPPWGLLFRACCSFKSCVYVTLKTNLADAPLSAVPRALSWEALTLPLPFHGSPPHKRPPYFLPSFLVTLSLSLSPSVPPRVGRGHPSPFKTTVSWL